MANNRVWVRCSVCEGQEARHLLAKYYPSVGWGVSIPFTQEIPDRATLEQLTDDRADFGPTTKNFLTWIDELHEFFQRHRHHPETTFTLEYESP